MSRTTSEREQRQIHPVFDEALRKQHWNLIPKDRYVIPSSHNSLVNAARAIAVAAYPSPKNHLKGGKAQRYSAALLAYIFRVSKLQGRIEVLPEWVANFRHSSMLDILSSGLRNLSRSFTIREIIHSALIMKEQNDRKLRGEKATFTLGYRPDLSAVDLEIPLEQTVEGYVLAGKIPDTELASLRAAILHHRPALARFSGPATTIDGRDEEYDYQNAYNRHVRPALFAQHIVQVVWEAAGEFLDESIEREISIDQILMRKAEWARDIHTTTNKYLAGQIFMARNLGVKCCWCEMTRFADPLADS